MSWFEFERIDLAITSILANQLVASESERARDHCQSDAYGQSEFFVQSFSDWLTILCLAVFRLITDVITNSNYLQTQTVSPG